MTVVHPNHIVGINSITVQTGDSLSVHKADGSLIRTIVSNTGVSTFHAIEVSKGGGDLTVGISTLFADNSTGKIGIGTDIPGEKLSVEDSSPAVLINATNASGESKLQFGRTGNTNVGEIKYEHSNNAFTFRTNDSADQLRIDSSGRLLIGTTTEGHDDSDELTLAGTRTGITIRSASDNYGNIFFSDATSGTGEYVGAVQYYHADNTLRLKTSSTDRLIISSTGDVDIPNGNIGIHTTDANTEHIAGAASSFIGLYMNDGFIGFPTHLNRNGGYFIATHVNALNAGPVSLGSSMTLHGTWTIV